MPPLRVYLAPLGLMIACADDSLHYELKGLTVRTEDFDEVCGGSFGYFERRLKWLERETGLAHEPVTFHWYLDGAPRKECSAGTGNCASGRSIYAEWFAFSHELVHAHLSRLGRPRIWLIEGMATMLEDGWSGEVDGDQTPSVMLQIDDALELDYWNAAGFTSYLRDRYGMAQLLEYYQASASTSANVSLELFGEVFGDSFADVEAEYLALDMFRRSGSPTCDALEVAWAGDTWAHDFVLACDEPGSLGPQQSWSDGDDDKGPGLFSNVTMTVAPGPVKFDLTATEPVWITISGCDRPEWVYLSPDEPRTDAELLGGRYLVSVQSYLEPVATVTMTARRDLQSASMLRGDIVAPGAPSGPLHSDAYPCRSRPAG